MRDLFQRLDPRARVLAVVAAIAVISSTPPSVLRPFPAYACLLLLLILCGRASGIYLTWRCVAASPFILLAAGMLTFQMGLAADGTPAGLAAGFSVALKGYTAALLLAFLTATTSLAEILWALRRLKAPQSLNLILSMMYRYTSLLSEEHARMERARECRTVRPLGRRRFAIHGSQFGSLILRSWDRADRVHMAMLARGFTGNWPSRQQRKFASADAAFLAAVSGLFVVMRVVLS